MSDIPPETNEIQETTQAGSDQDLTPEGRAAMQNSAEVPPEEQDAYIDDLTRYEEELFRYREQMRQQGNWDAAEQADREIEKIDRILFEQVQKKHGVKPE